MHQVGEEWAGGQVAVLLADNLIMQGTDGTYPKTETCTLFSEEKENRKAYSIEEYILLLPFKSNCSSFKD